MPWWVGRPMSPLFGKQRDQLGPHDVAVHGGHDSKESVILLDRQNAAHWLQDLAGREVDQGAFHGGNQVFVAQHLADGGFAEIGNLRIELRCTT